ncbi:hypothetical protein JCM11957_12010 [Caminibacter profundus]
MVLNKFLFYITVLTMLSRYTIVIGNYILFGWSLFYFFFRFSFFKKINVYVLIILAIFFIIDFYSMINGYYIYDLSFNIKWFFQIIFYCFIIMTFFYFYKTHFINFDKILMNIIWLLVIVTLIQLCYGFYVTNISIFDYRVWFSPMVYVFLTPSYEDLGLFKMTIGFLLPFFVIMISKKNKTKIYLSLYVVTYNLLIGNKSVLLALFGIYILYLITKIKTRIYKVFLLVIILFFLVCVVFNYKEIINEILIYEGRYFGPIFTNSNYWYNPLGIGAGNYVEAALKNIYNIYSDISAVTFDNNLDIHGWYSIAESDVILWSVRYGWFFYLFFILFLFYVNFILVTTRNKNTIKTILLFDYLVFSGITQDYSNILIYWGLIGFILGLIYKERYYNEISN